MLGQERGMSQLRAACQSLQMTQVNYGARRRVSLETSIFVVPLKSEIDALHHSYLVLCTLF